MTVQLALLGGPRTISRDGRPLTRRQELVLDLLREHPDGRDAAEIGAWLHAHRARRPHGVDDRCLYCASDAVGVLRSAGLRPLLIRRRTGMWQLREPDATAAGPDDAQLDSLPGDRFEDIFACRIDESGGLRDEETA